MPCDNQPLLDALLGTASVAGLRVAADGTIHSIGNATQLCGWLPAGEPPPCAGQALKSVLEPLFENHERARIEHAIEIRRAHTDAPPETLYNLISPVRPRGPSRSFNIGLLPLADATPGEWLLTITETTALHSLSVALEQARTARDLALAVLGIEASALHAFLQRATTDIASFRTLMRQPARTQSAMHEKLDHLLAIVEPLRQAADALPIAAVATPLGQLGNQLAELLAKESCSGDNLLPLALPLDAASTAVTMAVLLDERRRTARISKPAWSIAQQSPPWHEVCEQNCAELVRRLANRHNVLVTLRMRGIAQVPESCQRVVELALRPLLRNAVRHGIESPMVRAAAGKPASGKITVTITDRGADSIEMTVHDDGCGFDLARIRAAAEHSGLGNREELVEMEPRRLVSLVFRRRFSTAGLDEAPTEDDGVAQLRQLLLPQGGTISVATKPLRYTMFSVRLPVTAAAAPISAARRVRSAAS
jgi:signal transduction histidine kinase